MSDKYLYIKIFYINFQKICQNISSVSLDPNFVTCKDTLGIFFIQKAVGELLRMTGTRLSLHRNESRSIRTAPPTPAPKFKFESMSNKYLYLKIFYIHFQKICQNISSVSLDPNFVICKDNLVIFFIQKVVSQLLRMTGIRLRLHRNEGRPIRTSPPKKKSNLRA